MRFSWLLAFPVLLSPFTVQGQTSGTLPLAPTATFPVAWPRGCREVATYRDDAGNHLTVATRRATINRETLEVADWPHGQKPLVRALRQVQWKRREDSSSMVVSLHEDVGSLTPLRLTVSFQGADGISHRDYRLAQESPQVSWSSPFDNEGSGRAGIQAERATFFEEDLPLLVRLVEGGTSGTLVFRLRAREEGAHFKRLDAAGARLTVQPATSDVEVPAGGFRRESVCKVDVVTDDDRHFGFLVANDRWRTLLVADMGSAGAWELDSVRREEGLPE